MAATSAPPLIRLPLKDSLIVVDEDYYRRRKLADVVYQRTVQACCGTTTAAEPPSSNHRFPKDPILRQYSVRIDVGGEIALKEKDAADPAAPLRVLKNLYAWMPEAPEGVKSVQVTSNVIDPAMRSVFGESDEKALKAKLEQYRTQDIDADQHKTDKHPRFLMPQINGLQDERPINGLAGLLLACNKYLPALLEKGDELSTPGVEHCKAAQVLAESDIDTPDARVVVISERHLLAALLRVSCRMVGIYRCFSFVWNPLVVVDEASTDSHKPRVYIITEYTYRKLRDAAYQTSKFYARNAILYGDVRISVRSVTMRQPKTPPPAEVSFKVIAVYQPIVPPVNDAMFRFPPPPEMGFTVDNAAICTHPLSSYPLMCRSVSGTVLFSEQAVLCRAALQRRRQASKEGGESVDFEKLLADILQEKQEKQKQ